MSKGPIKTQYITAKSVVNFAISVEKAVNEANRLFAQHEFDLKQAKTRQAYDFAYKAYENDFEAVRSNFQEAENHVILLESKLHLLSGLPKMTVKKCFKKIKKLVTAQLSKTKIPKREVG